MFFKKKTPKSGSARLEQEMASIADQAMVNANALRDKRALVPISHSETEKLFTEANASGETVFNHYHFSEDMTQLDPEAQIHLMQFFGQLTAYNELLEHPDVERRLDWITANAAFFERYFARADVSTALLNNRPDVEVAHLQNDVEAADRKRLKQVAANMFNPGIDALVPRPAVPYMVAMGKPFEDGQRFINGVYFSAQSAPAVMGWISGLQTQETPCGKEDSRAHA